VLPGVDDQVRDTGSCSQRTGNGRQLYEIWAGTHHRNDLEHVSALHYIEPTREACASVAVTVGRPAMWAACCPATKNSAKASITRSA